MRLLLTTDTVGGVWTFTRELATELLERGHSVALVSFGRALCPEQQILVTGCEDRRTHQFCFAALHAPLEWMPHNAAAYALGETPLLNICREFRPDLLLLSQFCYGALPVDTPKIIVAHSDVLSWAEAVGKAPLEEDEWLSTYRTLVQRGLNGADIVVAPTQAMLNALGSGFALGSEAAVIANGRSVPATAKTPARSLQAITAGRLWDSAKNARLLREVLSPMPLLVAGDGGNGSLDTGSAVRLLGPLPEQHLHDYFRWSAIYICTSLYEPFGLAPLEAALCGCAVLANDIPSLREVWADGALYFHDAVSLSALLHDLYDDPEKLAAAQARSAERAAGYTASRVADEYLELASRIVQARHGSVAHAA